MSVFGKKKSKFGGKSKKDKKNSDKGDDSPWKEGQQQGQQDGRGEGRGEGGRQKEVPPEKEVWKYEGETDHEGKYHGIGKLQNLHTGEFYEGQWISGMREGFGSQKFATEERYQGSWKADKMDGPGTVSYPNGDTLEGIWENGKRISGHFQFNEGGITYHEKWTNDCPGPRGQLVFNSGGYYIGDVGFAQAGRYTVKNYIIYRHGYGEMHWSNNNKYIGNWKNDKRKGYGVYLQFNGPKYYGTWTKGKKSGYGIEIFLDGTYYEGGYMHDERKGKGKVVLPNGDVVLGDWHKNNVSNAVYYRRTFSDVPRPLRAVFIENVTAIQKTEDKAMFTTTEKWTGFISDLLSEISSSEGSDYDRLINDFNTHTTLTSTRTLSKFPTATPLSKLLDMFVNLFVWEYDGVKSAGKKEATFNLQTAVDDVHSFLACLCIGMADKFHLDYRQNKTLYELLMNHVFSRIYHVIFPLYQQVYKTMDAKLKSKVHELKEVTPVLIGVKPRFILDPAKKNIKEPIGNSHNTGNSQNSDGNSNGPTPFSVMMTPPPLPSTPAPPSARALPITPTKIDDAELDGVVERRPTKNTPSRKQQQQQPQNDFEISDSSNVTSESSSSEEDEDQDDDEEKETNLSSERSEVSGSESSVGLNVNNRSGGGGSGESESEVEIGRRKPPRQSTKPPTTTTTTTSKITTTSSTTSTTTTTTTTITLSPQKEKWEMSQRRYSKTLPTPIFTLTPPQQQQQQQQQQVRQSPTNSASTTPRTGGNSAVNSVKSVPSFPASFPNLPHSPPPNSSSTSSNSLMAYQKVIDTLIQLTKATTPISKLEMITSASNAILSCVDEFYTDKTQNILMGAEDKFPVLIYALIRANVPDLWSHCYMVQDFVSEHLGDEEAKYRASELVDAIKYIQSLDWNLRDKTGSLIPVKLILSSVTWAARAVDRLKFPEKVDVETERFEILQNLSTIFRGISQRRSDIYTPYKIAPKIAKYITKYEQFFTSCLEAKDVGLKLRKDKDFSSNSGSSSNISGSSGARGFVVYYLDFELYHPVYVYQKLSETCVILDAE